MPCISKTSVSALMLGAAMTLSGCTPASETEAPAAPVAPPPPAVAEAAEEVTETVAPEAPKTPVAPESTETSDEEEHDHDHDHDDHGSEEASMDKDHDDHGDHDDHSDEHAGHDDHDHGGVDPHAWLDPENAAIWATALAVELAQIDPAHAADYIANAAAFGEEMEALEEDLEARFAAIEGTIYAYHNALGYMAELGLDIEETIAGYDGDAPGPSTLQFIREDMAAHSQEGTPCLLTDPEAPQAMIDALENDTGVTVVSIAPTGLEGQSYAEIVGAIASAVETCVAN